MCCLLWWPGKSGLGSLLGSMTRTGKGTVLADTSLASKHQQQPESPILLLRNIFQTRNEASRSVLHLRGAGWGKVDHGCGQGWLPASPALQCPASSSCWGGDAIWQAKVAMACSGEEAPAAAVMHSAGKLPRTCLMLLAPTHCRLSHAGGHRVPGTHQCSGSSSLPSTALAAAPLSSLHPPRSSHPTSCCCQQLSPTHSSCPAFLGVLQAPPMLIPLRNCDANVLGAPHHGGGS